MRRLLSWVCFPWLLGLSLGAASLAVAPNDFGGTLLLIFGFLVLSDAEFWHSAAVSATYFYEEHPQVDWWVIMRDAYEPGHFYIRLIWLLPISVVISIAMTSNDALLWIVSGCAFCGYAVFLFVRFRQHIMDHMDNLGIRLKSYIIASEARFDTRNPDERQ